MRLFNKKRNANRKYHTQHTHKTLNTQASSKLPHLNQKKKSLVCIFEEVVYDDGVFMYKILMYIFFPSFGRDAVEKFDE